MASATAATRSEWRYVKFDFASTTSAKAWAMRSSRDSSAGMARSVGSAAAMASARLGACRADHSGSPLPKHAQRLDQLRIEPAPAPVARDGQGRRRTAEAPVDLGDLGQADDARIQRNLLPAQPFGVAAAVPVFVHGTDGDGGVFRDAEGAGDVGATVAADREHLALARGPDRQRGEPAETLQRRAVRLDVLERIGHFFPPAAPVPQPQAVLRRLVVAAKQLRDTRGVARAAGVLHQQRVEQVGTIVGRQLQLFRQPHADQAAARGVPLRLSLRQVQRIRHGRQDGGQLDAGHGTGRVQVKWQRSKVKASTFEFTRETLDWM